MVPMPKTGHWKLGPACESAWYGVASLLCSGRLTEYAVQILETTVTSRRYDTDKFVCKNVSLVASPELNANSAVKQWA